MCTHSPMAGSNARHVRDSGFIPISLHDPNDGRTGWYYRFCPIAYRNPLVRIKIWPSEIAGELNM